MVSKIFISYRRDDSAAAAGRLHDRLEQEFGRESIFMDVVATPLGWDFVEVLSAEVEKCDVLLAIIGPNWLDAKDEDGNRRLDSETDFVRIEIAAALKRKIPVIPILLDGTRIPKADRLPDELKSLARRHGLDVGQESFGSDVDRLVGGLRGDRVPLTPPLTGNGYDGQEPKRKRSPQESKPISAAAIVFGAGIALIVTLLGSLFYLIIGTKKPEPLAASNVAPLEPPPVNAAKPEPLVTSNVTSAEPLPLNAPRPGSEFTDWADGCPVMIVVSAGKFMMGSPANEPGRSADEGPRHEVTIAKPFAVAKFEVTFAEWNAFVGGGACREVKGQWGAGGCR